MTAHVCGYCDKPCHYESQGTRGAWWVHDHSGNPFCDEQPEPRTITEGIVTRRVRETRDCNTRHKEVKQ